jgi:hypothetical protein
MRVRKYDHITRKFTKTKNYKENLFAKLIGYQDRTLHLPHPLAKIVAYFLAAPMILRMYKKRLMTSR